MICKYGGIILPEAIQKDLKILEKTCHSDETFLDLLNRKLVVLNFTLSLPPPSPPPADSSDGETNKPLIQHPAVRIGRICLKWDSYLKPCLDIEVDDIDVLVEFVNIILTRNNW